MPARVEVELDIFSGMPNPTWVLTDAEADDFLKRQAALPPAPAGNLSGNLGYRGFIVQVVQGAGVQVVRVQAGLVQVTRGETTAFLSDKDRQLERWLLNSGKPYLKKELLEVAEHDIR